MRSPRSSSAPARASVSCVSALLLRHVGGFFFQPLTAKNRLLRTSARRLQLTAQIGMLAMSRLNPGLRMVAIGFRPGQRLAHGAKTRLRFVRALFHHSHGGTKRFQPMLALDDTRVMIGSAADAQPVAPHPFAAAGDD